MLKKLQRLANTHLIQKLFRQGRGYQNSLFSFRFLPSSHPGSRFAVVVSKKVAKKAVERNLLRRRANEILRTHWNEIGRDTVALVLLKPQPKQPTFQQMENGIIDFIVKIAS